MFQAVMTRDFNSVRTLQLIAKGINYFSGGQTVIRSMSSLVDLNLAGNKIQTLSNLENLRTLRSLNLNSNLLQEIPESLTLPALTTLNLDFNQIKHITNLKGVKKLENLSLAFNKVEDPSMKGSAFQLLDLDTLNLGGNQITSIKQIIYGYPKIQEISLKGNPLHSIIHNAFKECTDLQTLDICNIKLKNYRGDLNFLQACTNLTTLKMSGCFVERDFQEISGIPGLINLERLEVRDVGLLHLTGISERFQMLEVLDLQDNKIYELDAIDDLKLLSYLVELNLLDNPLMIHRSLKD